MNKLLLIVGFVLFFAAAVQARPEYNTSFYYYYRLDQPQTAEQQQLSQQVRTFRCNVCHVPDKDKSQRNEYGRVLEKLVPKYNSTAWRDKARQEKLYRQIVEAFDRAAKEKNTEYDLSYGEMIEKGYLPAPWK